MAEVRKTDTFHVVALREGREATLKVCEDCHTCFDHNGYCRSCNQQPSRYKRTIVAGSINALPQYYLIVKNNQTTNIFEDCPEDDCNGKFNEVGVCESCGKKPVGDEVIVKQTIIQ